jgi:hypothetical protein
MSKGREKLAKEIPAVLERIECQTQSQVDTASDANAIVI